MKYARLCFLCGLLTILFACASAGEDAQTTPSAYLLYFRTADLTSSASAGGDIFQTETITLPEDLDTFQQAEALLEALLEGPSDDLLRSTFPAGTTLLSAEVSEGQARVDFSRQYGTLSGVRLTMADYAVTLTLTQLPEIALVRITVQGQELAYRDKQIFTARDVLLSSEEDVVGTAEATLYFLDENGDLAGEHRTLDLYEGDTQVMAVARALENPPETRGLSAPLPENFRVKTVWLEEHTCYVNLSSALLPEGVFLGTALEALSRSLCSLDHVEDVRFLVDGEFARYYGDADVSAPYAYGR